jgi:hypothetical protein
MWLSITAYSDLSRTFFEIGALYYFLRYWKNNSRKILLASSVFLGFAICTKLVSIGTLIIFGIFIIFRKCVLKEKLGDLALLLTVSLGLAMPWFLTSYFYTANPFYPVLSELQLPHSPVVLLSPLVFLKTFINAFLFSPDPISPFYLSFLPLLLGKFKPIVKKHGILLLLSLASYIMWYATSQTGGARFLTSYIPLYTVLGLLVIKEYKKGIIYFFVAVTVIVICLNISYRFVANAKYIPVILGIQSRQVFLMNQLNFDFGDFYDENGEIAAIVGDDKVLLVNMHNLFYVDFPFTLAEWRGRDYKYILVQKSQLPEVYKDALLIYKNDKTHVKLYKL